MVKKELYVFEFGNPVVVYKYTNLINLFGNPVLTYKKSTHFTRQYDIVSYMKKI